MCHSVRGTPASGSVAPDLTHVASRRTIAAGTLENTRDHLSRWISDSQKIKRSTMMFLFAVPVMEAMAVYLIPLMVGARNIVFPRLNAFGYWIYY
jgi:cytochrome c oxidase subunit 2